MVQAQFNLDESLWTFVQKSWQSGFQNQDELIRVVLGKLQQACDSGCADYGMEWEKGAYIDEYQESVQNFV